MSMLALLLATAAAVTASPLPRPQQHLLYTDRHVITLVYQEYDHDPQLYTQNLQLNRRFAEIRQEPNPQRDSSEQHVRINPKINIVTSRRENDGDNREEGRLYTNKDEDRQNRVSGHKQSTSTEPSHRSPPPQRPCNVTLTSDVNNANGCTHGAVENEVRHAAGINSNRKANKTKAGEDDRWIWESGTETTQPTTLSTVDLDDRAAFNGDKCPTGKVKVQGKCVEED